mmetsp:Transcript_26142/g.43214  ORF Transcript_26142/g.43214 Transcript_26142/m.43214 type:complete len:604 (-) Transcript_26142:168-1979(-)
MPEVPWTDASAIEQHVRHVLDSTGLGFLFEPLRAELPILRGFSRSKINVALKELGVDKVGIRARLTLLLLNVMHVETVPCASAPPADSSEASRKECCAKIASLVCAGARSTASQQLASANGPSPAECDGGLHAKLSELMRPLDRAKCTIPEPWRWPDIYMVVHSVVAIRASPSTSAAIVGSVRADTLVYAHEERDGWIRLFGCGGWMLINGHSLGFGVLLRPMPVSPWAQLQLHDNMDQAEPEPTSCVTMTSAQVAGYRDSPILALALLPSVQLKLPFLMPLQLERGSTEAIVHLVARVIAERGFIVCKGGLEPSLLEGVVREARLLYSEECMHPGETGGNALRDPQGRDVQHTSSMGKVRGDFVIWLREHLNGSVGGGEEQVKKAVLRMKPVIELDKQLERFGCAVTKAVSALIEESSYVHDDFTPSQLTSIVNDDFTPDTAHPRGSLHCGMGAACGPRGQGGQPLRYCGRSDMMVTVYPGDNADGVRGYLAHVDNTSPGGDGNTSHRLLTMVTYLNAEWDAAGGGGELRLFLPSGGVVPPKCTGVIDVIPHADVIVLFRSDLVLHEVRPANSQRLAATIWFHADHCGVEELGDLNASSFWT